MSLLDHEMKAFVTGATGMLGSQIARELRRDGHHVSALTRSGGLPEDLLELGVEPIRGDLSDVDQLAAAMEGQELVFHAAANINMWRNRWSDSIGTNLTGTRNLLEAALRVGVKKVVHTSTGSTIGKPEPRDGAPVTVDEKSEYNMSELAMVYPHTKWLGEQEVAKAVDGGLDAVITHPSMIFGPSDFKGNLLPLFRGTRAGTLLVAPGGYRCTCDVRDVARGHLQAAQKGLAGEHYILSGETLSARELFNRIAKAVDGRSPLFTLPDRVMLGLGSTLDALADLTGRPPLLSWEMAYQSTIRVHLSSEKAQAELGYRNRPLDESLRDATAWYRQMGLL